MNKIKIIKKIIGEQLKDYEFYYYKSEPNTWTFQRIYKDDEQYISIFESNYSRKIRLELYTSKDFYNVLEVRDFCPEWEEKYGGHYSWEFNNEETFIHILNEFVFIIINYGLDALNILSETTKESKIDITKNMYLDLYRNHLRLSQDFINTYNVSITNLKQGIDIIIKIMKEKQDVEYDEIKELLISMAAYYGEAINHRFNGSWKWDDREDICVLILNVQKRKREWLPLNHIIISWAGIKENDKFLLAFSNELWSYE
jgi:hypothetical protein